jgi:hypothetical protein
VIKPVDRARRTSHLTDRPINLVFVYEGVADAALRGHSCVGMVITGVHCSGLSEEHLIQ